MGRGGGYKNGRGGAASEVLPLQKGGTGKVLAILKWGGGHNKFRCSFNHTEAWGGGGHRFCSPPTHTP